MFMSNLEEQIVCCPFGGIYNKTEGKAIYKFTKYDKQIHFYANLKA